MQYFLFFVCYSLHRHVIYTNGISAAAVVATALTTLASIALTRRVGWCSLKKMLQFSLMNTFIIWKIINYTSSTLQPEQSLYLVSYADSERADAAIQLAGTCFLFSLLCWLQHEIIDHRSLFLFMSIFIMQIISIFQMNWCSQKTAFFAIRDTFFFSNIQMVFHLVNCK